MTKSRGILSSRRFWTEVELELLRCNYADTKTEDLAIALGRTLSTVYQKARKLDLAKSPEFVAEMSRQAMLRPDHGGRKVQFPKGHVPANKGLRRPGWTAGNMAKTQFKKGQMPHTWMPVGSYRVNGDGWLELKFSDEPGPYMKRWIPVHRKVWIDANGPIPRGHIVVFKRGRRSTDPALITIDAIECISLVENMRRNTLHNMPKELVQITQLRGVLNRAINKRAKAEEPHEQ